MYRAWGHHTRCIWPVYHITAFELIYASDPLAAACSPFDSHTCKQERVPRTKLAGSCGEMHYLGGRIELRMSSVWLTAAGAFGASLFLQCSWKVRGVAGNPLHFLLRVPCDVALLFTINAVLILHRARVEKRQRPPRLVGEASVHLEYQRRGEGRQKQLLFSSDDDGSAR